MKTVVVVPTFNEAVNLPGFVPAVLEQSVPGLGNSSSTTSLPMGPAAWPTTSRPARPVA